MNIINTEVQLGITYTLNPALFLSSQPVLYPAHILSPQLPSQREVNLETSFKLLQQKYEALLLENEELKNRLEGCSVTNAISLEAGLGELQQAQFCSED